MYFSDGSPLKSLDSQKKDAGPSKGPSQPPKQPNENAQKPDDQPNDCYLQDLYQQISDVVSSNPDMKVLANEGKSF